MGNSRTNPDNSTTPKIIIDNWIPIASSYQQITNPAGTGLSPPAGARMALIGVRSGTVNFRDDGVAPDASHGINMVAGQTEQYQGDLTKVLYFGTCVLDVLYYQ